MTSRRIITLRKPTWRAWGLFWLVFLAFPPPARSADIDAQDFSLSDIPTVTLITQAGRAVRFPQDFRDHRYLLFTFIYTSCKESCPLLTAIFAAVQREREPTPESLRLVSISVDPERDTPSVLRAYAQRHGADVRSWTFLTGRRQDIDQVTRSLGVFSAHAAGHQPRIFLWDQRQGNGMKFSGLVPPGRLLSEMAP